MGAEAWHYFVPYQPDIEKALQELRRREFEAGRYNPATSFPFASPLFRAILRLFPLPPPRRHATIEEALEDSEADGTRSILDMQRVSDEPALCAVTAVPEESLREVYGTAQPTREMIEANMGIDGLDRGQGLYIVVHKDGKPSEIFFGGWSFD